MREGEEGYATTTEIQRNLFKANTIVTIISVCSYRDCFFFLDFTLADINLFQGLPSIFIELSALDHVRFREIPTYNYFNRR